MSSILLVRHGQASFGAKSYDYLSERGRSQAIEVGRWLKKHEAKFDGLLCGPRRRQYETADAITVTAGLENLSIEMCSELDEFGEGEEIFLAAEAMTGKSMFGPQAPAREALIGYYVEAYKAWCRGEVEIPGRSSFIEFRRQIAQWLIGFTRANRTSGQHTLVISSAGVIAAVVCEALELGDEHWAALVAVMENASMTEILHSKGRIGLRYFNTIAHLSPELKSGI